MDKETIYRGKMIWFKNTQFVELNFQNISYFKCHGIAQHGMTPDFFPIMLNIFPFFVNGLLVFIWVGTYKIEWPPFTVTSFWYPLLTLVLFYRFL